MWGRTIDQNPHVWLNTMRPSGLAKTNSLRTCIHYRASWRRPVSASGVSARCHHGL